MCSWTSRCLPLVSAAFLTGSVVNLACAQVPVLPKLQGPQLEQKPLSAPNDGKKKKAKNAWEAMLAEDELWHSRREPVAAEAHEADLANDRRARKEAEARLATIDDNHRTRLRAIEKKYGGKAYKAAVEKLSAHRAELKRMQALSGNLNANPAWHAVLAEEDRWRSRREGVIKDIRDAERAKNMKAERAAIVRLSTIDENHTSRLQAIRKEHGDRLYQIAIEELKVRRQKDIAKRDRSQVLADRAAEQNAAEQRAAEQRLAAERKAEEQRAAAERMAAEQRAAEMRAAEEKARREAAEVKAVQDELERARRVYEQEVGAANRKYLAAIERAKSQAGSSETVQIVEQHCELAKEHQEELQELQVKHAESESDLDQKLEDQRARGRKAVEAGQHPGRGAPVQGREHPGQGRAKQEAKHGTESESESDNKGKGNGNGKDKDKDKDKRNGK